MPIRNRSAALHSVFERTIHERRRSLTMWAVGMFTLALVMTGLYPTIRGNPQLAKLHDTYPEALRSLFGITDLTTGIGYLRAEVFSLVAPLLLIVLAVLWGGDLIAGEEDRGTVDILMANPISRSRVLLEKWAALVVGVVIAAGGLAIGLVIGILTTGMHLGMAGLSAALLATALLSIVFGTVSLTVGAATGNRALARGSAVALAVIAYLISALADMVDWLKEIRPLSPWYHALGVDPLASGFSLVHFAVLIGVTGAVGLLGVVAFDRRDLAV